VPGRIIGGIAGQTDNSGAIANCRNCGEINGTGNGHCVGGIVGEGTSWSVTGCTNSGKVSGYQSVGGISGIYGIVSGCSNSAAIIATTNQAGGISGDTNSVTGSFNYGPVNGNGYVGGVCGSLNYSISGCFNTASVTGTSPVGSVVGYNSGTVNDCRYVLGTPIGYNAGTTANVTTETIASLQGTTGLDLLNNAIKDWNENGTYKDKNDQVQPVKGSIYACDYHFVADDATTPANNGYPVIAPGAPQ
jgi:hypothetical protein